MWGRRSQGRGQSQTIKLGGSEIRSPSRAGLVPERATPNGPDQTIPARSCPAWPGIAHLVSPALAPNPTLRAPRPVVRPTFFADLSSEKPAFAVGVSIMPGIAGWDCATL